MKFSPVRPTVKNALRAGLPANKQIGFFGENDAVVTSYDIKTRHKTTLSSHHFIC